MKNIDVLCPTIDESVLKKRLNVEKQKTKV